MEANGYGKADGLIREVITAIISEMSKDGELKLTLTVQKTAQLLGINVTKMYEISRMATFPSIKIGKRVVVPVVPLLAWIEKEAWNNNN